jgi:predicted chitinase
VHLDLSNINVKREEAMYIAQCLNDSSNLVCCHLTGNQVDYYGRLFLRAHLNAIVQFPI